MSLPLVEHVPIGDVAVDTVWWTLGGQLSLTVCAKATLAMEQGADMTLLSPTPLHREEVKRLPSLCVRAPAEVLPQLPQPEVTLVGHAVNLEEKGTSRVRLVVTRDGDALLDKKLVVVGDRKAGEPRPFAKMALSYERALGGIGFADNPLGRGMGDDDRPPNVLSAADGESQVGSFAPIPAAFAMRKRKLRGGSAKPSSQGCVDIPDAFDWSYFQSAPEDQHLDAITGEEWIWLEGMHPQHRHLRSRLPSARAMARIYGPAPGTVPDLVPLRAESLHIDADRGVCTLVWRGSFPSRADIPHMLIAAGVSLCGEAIPWPTTPAELQALHAACTRRDDEELVAQRVGETMVVGYTSDPPPAATLVGTRSTKKKGKAAAETLPFQNAGPKPRFRRRPKGGLPGAPWSDEKGREVEVAPVKTTLPLEGSPEQARALREELDRRLEEADAKKRLEAEQAARREADAAAFEAEQRAAAEAEEKRKAAEAERKRKEAKELIAEMYGRFKR